jgi:hypothetical protein
MRERDAGKREAGRIKNNPLGGYVLSALGKRADLSPGATPAVPRPKPVRPKPTRPRSEPRTQRVVSSDPELFDEGLDFYFGVLDSAIGFRGVQSTSDESPRSGASQVIPHERMRAPAPGSETMTWMHVGGRKLSSRPPDSITDRQLAAIAYGRRVRAALTTLPWGMQQTLQRYYSSARALAAVAGVKIEAHTCGPQSTKAEIRAAHRAYAAAAVTALPPTVVDPDVTGDAPERARYRERGPIARTDAERKDEQRARDKTEHEGSSLAKRYCEEDDAGRRAAEVAEPLVRHLQPGRNPYPTTQYSALASYFVDGGADLRGALKRGMFTTAGGRIEIVRDNEERLTLREYSRRTGIARTTLQRRVGHLALASIARGQENLFVVAELDRAFANRDT